MHRTQIYLDEADYQSLTRMSRREGRSMADLVRTAVRRLLDDQAGASPEDVLDDTFGLWRGHDAEATLTRRVREEWSEREKQLGPAD